MRRQHAFEPILAGMIQDVSIRGPLHCDNVKNILSQRAFLFQGRVFFHRPPITPNHNHIALVLNSATVNPSTMCEMAAETTGSESGSLSEPEFKYFLDLLAEIRVKIYDLL